MHWGALGLGPFGMLWVGFGVLWTALGCVGILFVLWALGYFGDALGCSGVLCAALGCLAMIWDTLGRLPE